MDHVIRPVACYCINFLGEYGYNKKSRITPITGYKPSARITQFIYSKQSQLIAA